MAENQAAFEQLCKSAIFYIDQWHHDDPHPTRHFATLVTDHEKVLLIQFEPFWFDLEESIYCKLLNNTRKFIPSKDRTKLYCLPRPDSLWYSSNFLVVPLDDDLRAKLPLDGKTVALNLLDTDDPEVQTIIQNAVAYMTELQAIQEARSYKTGWVYYQFRDYERSLLEQGRYSFSEGVKGTSQLMLAVEQFKPA
ncbi:MAG TPA: hypothetical protein V6D06_05235 [Trichocoleus sp.]